VVAGAAVALAILMTSVSSAMAKSVAVAPMHSPSPVVHSAPPPTVVAVHAPAHPAPPPVVAVHAPPPPVLAVHAPAPPPVVAVHTPPPPVVVLKVTLPVAHAAGHKIA
jgi:hypothetical protein